VFVVPEEVLAAILAHAEAQRPLECCGLLVGRGSTVGAAVAMRNASPTPASKYVVDDGEHIELRRVLRKFSPPLEIIGVYHSHPAGAARPSATDVAEAHYAGWLHLIVGWNQGHAEVRGYLLSHGAVTDVELVPASPGPG
jgi:proteasome lid subunit RPN8/RPN11